MHSIPSTVLDMSYCTDPAFQLELNLQRLRKEFVEMFEAIRCVCECCSASDGSPSAASSSGRGSRSATRRTDDSSSDTVAHHAAYLRAPAASSLPRPMWQPAPEPLAPAPRTPDRNTLAQHIEAWIDASSRVGDNTRRAARNTTASLVTIQSVRPADLPPRVNQRSSTRYSSNPWTSSSPAGHLRYAVSPAATSQSLKASSYYNNNRSFLSTSSPWTWWNPTSGSRYGTSKAASLHDVHRWGSYDGRSGSSESRTWGSSSPQHTSAAVGARRLQASDTQVAHATASTQSAAVSQNPIPKAYTLF